MLLGTGEWPAPSGVPALFGSWLTARLTASSQLGVAPTGFTGFCDLLLFTSRRRMPEAHVRAPVRDDKAVRAFKMP
jgi:hypothetical protein